MFYIEDNRSWTEDDGSEFCYGKNRNWKLPLFWQFPHRKYFKVSSYFMNIYKPLYYKVNLNVKLFTSAKFSGSQISQ